MDVEINKLAKYFTELPLQIEGIYRFTQKPGKSWPSYTEPFPGFVFPLKGEVAFTFDGTPYLFTPGKVIHGGAKMRLTEKESMSNKDWEYLLVLYRTGDPRLEALSISDSHFELAVGRSPRLYDLLERLWYISFQSGNIPEFQGKVLFYMILDEVFSCARNQDTGHSKRLFDQVSAYIHEHYNEPLTVSMLAEQREVTRNRISYVFNKYSGMGPGDYLLNYRLNRGKEMLLVKDMTIQEIALQIGFNDPFYFSRAFKKKFGLAPKEYRDKFINNPS